MEKPEIVEKLGDRICKLIDGDAAAQDIARLTEAYVKLITAEEPGAKVPQEIKVVWGEGVEQYSV